MMSDDLSKKPKLREAIRRTRALPARLRSFTQEVLARPQLEHISTGSFEWVYSQQGQGPPLLLIHGLSASVTWWRRNIPAFAQHFTVYAVELRGFAGNRAERPLPLLASADGLRAFMDALGIDAACVVGHSMGGQISLHLAARSPERVKRLVLAAPSGLVRRGLVPMAIRLARAQRYGALDFAPTILLDALRAGPVNLWLAARQLLRDDVEELLPAITAPTLVLAGERDVILPVEVCQAVADGIPGGSFSIVAGAGHNLMVDRAQVFNETVLQFLLGENSSDQLRVSQGKSEQPV